MLAFLGRKKRLLIEIANMNPIQDDKNEEIVWWCAFCGKEARNEHPGHQKDCLWLRIRNEVCK